MLGRKPKLDHDAVAMHRALERINEHEQHDQKRPCYEHKVITCDREEIAHNLVGHKACRVGGVCCSGVRTTASTAK